MKTIEEIKAEIYHLKLEYDKGQYITPDTESLKGAILALEWVLVVKESILSEL